jgi:anti-sigma factor RsiW
MLDSLRNLGKSEHEWVEESLSPYIDGELSAKETARVERHLQECRACAENLATLRQTVTLLKELPTVSAPRSFAVRPAPVRPKVRAAAPGWGYGLLKGATALAALLLVVLISGDLALQMLGGFRLAAPGPMAPAAEVALAPSEVATITPAEAADEWMVGEAETMETATVETPPLNAEEAPPPAAAETEAPEAYRAPSPEGTATPVSEGVEDAEAAGTPTAEATPAGQEAEQIGAGHAATPIPTTMGSATPVPTEEVAEPIATPTPLTAPAEQKAEYAEPSASPAPPSTPEAVAIAEVPGEEAEARDQARLWAQTGLLSPLRLAELVAFVILLLLIPATLVTGWLMRRQGP